MIATQRVQVCLITRNSSCTPAALLHPPHLHRRPPLAQLRQPLAVLGHPLNVLIDVCKQGFNAAFVSQPLTSTSAGRALPGQEAEQ